MEGILLDTMFELPSLSGVTECAINKEVVEGRATPLKIYADQRKGDAASERAWPIPGRAAAWWSAEPRLKRGRQRST